ncbi:MAG: CorA family divalent cation transporter [Hungatella sp.]
MKYLLKEKLTVLPEEEDFPENSKGIEIWSLEDLRSFADKLPHRRLFLRAIENPQYCKAEMYGGYVFGTMVIPKKASTIAEHHAFGFYLQKDRLYFVDDGNMVKDILGKMMDVPYQEDSTLGSLLVVFLDYLIQEDVLHLQEMEKKLSDLEEMLLTEIPKDFYLMIMRYRKEILSLHTYYEQLIDVGAVLEADNCRLFTADEVQSFGQFTNRCSRLHDHIEMLREYMMQIREMYQSQLDINQNRAMNLLTIMTTLFFPLSIIVGWYGMNFEGMPELSWKYGYLGMILMSAVIIILEIRFFKKKKIL